MTDPAEPPGANLPADDRPTSKRVEVASSSDGRPVQLPRGIVVATAWTWRLLLLGVGLYALTFLVLARTQVVTTPLLIAILVTALLYPLHKLLRRARFPAVLAGATSVLLLLALVVGAFYLVGQQVT